MGWLKKVLGKAGRERAAALVAEGVAAAQAGDLAKAERLYSSGVDADPDYALAHLNLALARMDLYNAASSTLEPAARKERLLQIEGTLERVLSLDGSLLAAWRCLGHVAWRLGHDPRAEEAFVHLLDTAPDDFPHMDEARQALRAVAPRAKRTRATDAALRTAVDLDAPAGVVQQALDEVEPFALDEELPPYGHFARGALKRRLGDDAGAQAAFEACVAADAHHVEARRALASLFLARGDLQAALDHSVEAYRDEPQDAGLVCNVGVC